MSEHKISHPDMVRRLFKDPTTIHLTPDQINLLHAAVGLAGEAGEVLDLVLKDEASRRDELVNELGDVEFYLESVRQALGITFPCLGMDTQSQATPLEDAAGMSVCACSLLDAAKKSAFNGRDDQLEALHTEVFKMACFLDLVRSHFNITRQETLDANIAKLGARYDGFEYSDEAAAARRDEE